MDGNTPLSDIVIVIIIGIIVINVVIDIADWEPVTPHPATCFGCY